MCAARASWPASASAQPSCSAGAGTITGICCFVLQPRLTVYRMYICTAGQAPGGGHAHHHHHSRGAQLCAGGSSHCLRPRTAGAPGSGCAGEVLRAFPRALPACGVMLGSWMLLRQEGAGCSDCCARIELPAGWLCMCQSTDTAACLPPCVGCVQLRAAFLAADGASALRELLDNPSDRVGCSRLPDALPAALRARLFMKTHIYCAYLQLPPVDAGIWRTCLPAGFGCGTHPSAGPVWQRPSSTAGLLPAGLHPSSAAFCLPLHTLGPANAGKHMAEAVAALPPLPVGHAAIAAAAGCCAPLLVLQRSPMHPACTPLFPALCCAGGCICRGSLPQQRRQRAASGCLPGSALPQVGGYQCSAVQLGCCPPLPRSRPSNRSGPACH